MLTLTISHNIYLTRDQRYELTNGKTIETIGLYIPVWFYKGNTSEPGKEIFCKYILKNERLQDPIIKFDEGYIVNLPIQIDNMNCEKHLLDIKDGGIGCLFYREITKVKKPYKYELINFVQISPYEDMVKSLNYDNG